MKQICVFLICLSCCVACCKTNRKFVRANDVDSFLDPARWQITVDQQLKEAAFWSARLSKDSSSFVNKEELARACLQLFHTTGKPYWLDSAFVLLQSASASLRQQDPDLLFALSQSSITRHQFKQAASYHQEARRLKADRYTACLLDFDIAMELGDYAKARKSLAIISDKEGFDYLIRQAKWEDQEGNTAKAISLMERAMVKVRYQPVLTEWVQSNLADMYGHAGRIKESYLLYQKVLATHPGNLHCLEGLAWIAFAHDRNNALAKRIYRFISSVKFAPEINLKLAAIAVEEGNRSAAETYQSAFLQALSREQAGEMYNQYLIETLASAPATADSAVRLAERECRNRFTPLSADLYAWSVFRKGDTATAYAFAKAYVYKRTAEPKALLHTASIFAASGNNKAALAMLEDCRESAFELGPVNAAEVERLYQSIRSRGINDVR